MNINKVGATLASTYIPSSNSLSPSTDVSFGRRARRGSVNQRMKELKPFQSGDIKILLLENINKQAVQILEGQGYQVEFIAKSLPDDELTKKIQDVHVIGIRSKTTLNSKVLENAKNLLAIGCFCIGTNQVDLEFAASKGIAVFNSPFSNSRSVAELVIGYIIALARQIGDRSMELHSGAWNKVSNGCWEIRGKTLGIIGYGHIGSQLSVLAESMGMQVLYFDIVNIMGMGTAIQVDTLEELLERSDFVTLHVPALPETKNMISTNEFKRMKEGSYLINASRGQVIDIPALVEAKKSGKLAGLAVDVYPNEPGSNGPNMFVDSLNPWTSELVSLPNVILTPHIGGSTNEAQRAIGIEVANALTKYVKEGCSVGSVNFPEVDLRQPYREESGAVRVLYVHRNVPGVLRTVNEILGEYNIAKQFSDSEGDVAYLMADLANVNEQEMRKLNDALDRTPHRILTRLLY